MLSPLLRRLTSAITCREHTMLIYQKHSRAGRRDKSVRYWRLNVMHSWLLAATRRRLLLRTVTAIFPIAIITYTSTCVERLCFLTLFRTYCVTHGRQCSAPHTRVVSTCCGRWSDSCSFHQDSIISVGIMGARPPNAIVGPSNRWEKTGARGPVWGHPIGLLLSETRAIKAVLMDSAQAQMLWALSALFSMYLHV